VPSPSFGTPIPSSPAVRSATPSAASSPTAALPALGHVWIVVLENTGYDRVVNGDDVPFLRGLIDRYGLAESYFGVARPSQPNYFALFSGSTHDVTDNDPHDIDAPTIADQIEASGRTWREYAENVPPDCFTGSSSKGGRDGPGEYRRKHAPAISYTSIRTNPARCAFIEDFSAFRPGDVDYALIIPNQCNSAHDCAIHRADGWLASFVPQILDSEAFKAGGALVITFDEDAGDDPSGGHVTTIVATPSMTAGTRSAVRYDHYSLLRTVQDAWGLDCLARSCEATPMTDLFAAR
jgi:phosphatidylinositol-3-phosphatase